MGKEWKDVTFEDCPECGGGMLVYTTAEDGYCYDSDDALCSVCGFYGSMSVDEDGNAWIQEP